MSCYRFSFFVQFLLSDHYDSTNVMCRYLIVFFEHDGHGRRSNRVEQPGQPVGRRVRDGAPLAAAGRAAAARSAAVPAASAALCTATTPPVARGAAERICEPGDCQCKRAWLHGPVLPATTAAVRTAATASGTTAAPPSPRPPYQTPAISTAAAASAVLLAVSAVLSSRRAGTGRAALSHAYVSTSCIRALRLSALCVS